MAYSEIPSSVAAFMQRITDLCGDEHADWAENFNACFANTLLTTVNRHDDGTTFLLTGDIPAMWLRDSTAQLRPYLVIADGDDDLASMIAGLVRQQFRFIGIDPYANAFNETPSGATWDPDDRSERNWSSFVAVNVTVVSVGSVTSAALALEAPNARPPTPTAKAARAASPFFNNEPFIRVIPFSAPAAGSTPVGWRLIVVIATRNHPGGDDSHANERHRRPDSYARSTLEAWNGSLVYSVIRDPFGRLPSVGFADISPQGREPGRAGRWTDDHPSALRGTSPPAGRALTAAGPACGDATRGRSHRRASSGPGPAEA